MLMCTGEAYKDTDSGAIQEAHRRANCQALRGLLFFFLVAHMRRSVWTRLFPTTACSCTVVAVRDKAAFCLGYDALADTSTIENSDTEAKQSDTKAEGNSVVFFKPKAFRAGSFQIVPIFTALAWYVCVVIDADHLLSIVRCSSFINDNATLSSPLPPPPPPQRTCL